MLDVLKSDDPFQVTVISNVTSVLEDLAEMLKTHGEGVYIAIGDREEFLDSLADQIVTATGLGTFLGMNVPEALNEVNRSNYSKFVNGEPVFNENLKIMKGPDYTPPDLTPFI